MWGRLFGESAMDNTWWNSGRGVSEGQHLVEGEAVPLMASLFGGEAVLLMASLFLFLILFLCRLVHWRRQQHIILAETQPPIVTLDRANL